MDLVYYRSNQSVEIAIQHYRLAEGLVSDASHMQANQPVRKGCSFAETMAICRYCTIFVRV